MRGHRAFWLIGLVACLLLVGGASLNLVYLQAIGYVPGDPAADQIKCWLSNGSGTGNFVDGGFGCRINDGTTTASIELTRARPLDSLIWNAGSMNVDGANCALPVVRTINGGPRVHTINCADSNSSVLYGHATMPDSYDGGTLTFELIAENENTTPSGILDFDFSVQCRGDPGTGDVINATWGAVQNISITFSTRWAVEHSTTAAVTGNGPCLAGDTLFWRAVMDATATTTQAIDTYVLGVKMEYGLSGYSD